MSHRWRYETILELCRLESVGKPILALALGLVPILLLTACGGPSQTFDSIGDAAAAGDLQEVKRLALTGQSLSGGFGCTQRRLRDGERRCVRGHG